MEYRRFLSERCSSVEFSGIRKVFDLAAKIANPIDLSIGQPDYDASPELKAAAAAAIRDGHNRYTMTAGLGPLRERVAAALQAEFGWKSDVLISTGVSGGLLLSLLVILSPGDEVVFLDPYFVSYQQLVRMIGGKPVAVSSYPQFAFPADAVERAITPRTKAILLNSPGNPTGRVMTPAEVRAAADLADRHNLLLISDEIYCGLSYDAPSPSPAAVAPERTILLRGFGKSHGITGWRMGYVAAARPLIEEMTKMQQYTFVCAPSFAQYALLETFDADVSFHARDYAAKRDLAVRLLTRAFDVVRPGGGFYVFPRVPAGFANASDFCEAAAQRGVLVIPGKVFSSQDTHFRISYATSDEHLRRGCEILCELANPR